MTLVAMTGPQAAQNARSNPNFLCAAKRFLAIPTPLGCQTGGYRRTQPAAIAARIRACPNASGPLRSGAMIAFALAALVATGPVSLMSEERLDDKIAETHKLPFPQRVEQLSALFLGTSYGEYPLGDGGTGPEPWPRWRTDKVDCQTFIETVLAMSNARNLKEAKRVLDDIRYEGDPSFETRNHFTESQWLPANTKKGYLRDEVPSIDGGAPTETLTLSRAVWSQVPGLKRLLPANIQDGKFSVRYLPMDELRQKVKSIEPGSIIFVVREYNPQYVVRISHMGFVIKSPKGWFVRHAATTSHRQVIDEPFGEYIQRMSSFSKWKVTGFALAMPVDASLRVSEISKQP
jgi:hypothetical protein